MSGIYIGGLTESITTDALRISFIPYGPIKTIDIPVDFKTGKTKGFAFLEYVSLEDAKEAVFNMDGSELQNRTLNVKISDAKLSHKKNDAIWTSDEWLKDNANASEAANAANDNLLKAMGIMEEGAQIA